MGGFQARPQLTMGKYLWESVYKSNTQPKSHSLRLINNDNDEYAEINQRNQPQSANKKICTYKTAMNPKSP